MVSFILNSKTKIKHISIELKYFVSFLDIYRCVLFLPCFIETKMATSLAPIIAESSYSLTNGLFIANPPEKISDSLNNLALVKDSPWRHIGGFKLSNVKN